jgi:hypothetical protein
MSPETRVLAELCCDVANQAADADHFVPVGKLVELLGAEITARPLLVEGMLAAPTAGGKWLVLVDSDSGRFVEGTYREERSGHSLSPRLRFTIAHELGHLLQLKSEEKGGKTQGKAKTARSLVRDWEKEADRLSPLLLVSEAALGEFCTGGHKATLEDFLAARYQWGISREVLVQRFNLLLDFDRLGLRHNTRLRNLAFGLGEWNTSGQAVLCDWPKPFRNLDANLAPAFLLNPEAGSHEIREAFSDSAFCFNGGSKCGATGEVWVGTGSSPRREQRRFRISVEDLGRRSGRFLYLLDGN